MKPLVVIAMPVEAYTQKAKTLIDNFARQYSRFDGPKDELGFVRCLDAGGNEWLYTALWASNAKPGKRFDDEAFGGVASAITDPRIRLLWSDDAVATMRDLGLHVPETVEFKDKPTSVSVSATTTEAKP